MDIHSCTRSLNNHLIECWSNYHPLWWGIVPLLLLDYDLNLWASASFSLACVAMSVLLLTFSYMSASHTCFLLIASAVSSLITPSESIFVGFKVVCFWILVMCSPCSHSLAPFFSFFVSHAMFSLCVYMTKEGFATSLPSTTHS